MECQYQDIRKPLEWEKQLQHKKESQIPINKKVVMIQIQQFLSLLINFIPKAQILSQFILLQKLYLSSMKKLFIFAQKQQPKRSSTTSKNSFTKPIQLLPETYKYYLGSGNNSALIRKIMHSRKNWQQINDSKSLTVNFKWQQSNKGYHYDSNNSKKLNRQVLNHFEYHQELSNKEYLFRNILEYCELNKNNAFEFLPPTFVLNTLDCNFETQQAQFLAFYNQHSPQQSNELPKTLLHIKKPILIPSTYINQDKKIHTIYSKYELKQPFTSPNTKALWILKPTFLNRGNGVHVFNTLAQLETLMNKYIRGPSQQPGATQSTASTSKPAFTLKQPPSITIQSSSFIIQKYMQRPLLISGRKFDIRVWVLFSHQFKVYLFRQGYIRTSSLPFTTSQEKVLDLSVHLTNNAVQKYNADYCKYQKGNQLSFKTLKQILEERGKSLSEFLSKMKQLIKLSALSVRRRINRMQRYSCFQIFGYDFMIDELECRPWLIEVNTNPCIEESSPVLEQFLPRMIDDAFALTMDKLFPTVKVGQTYAVEGEQNGQNLWDLVIDLKKV